MENASKIEIGWHVIVVFLAEYVLLSTKLQVKFIKKYLKFFGI